MSEDIRKIIKRNGLRVIVRQICKEALSLLPSEGKLSSEIKPKINSFKLSVQKYTNEIDTLDGDILQIIKEDDLAKELEEKCKFDLEYQEALIKIEDALAVTSQGEGVSNYPASVSDFDSQRTKRKQVRLPKLELPTFHGDPVNWPPFWDAFDAAVNKDEDLTDGQKFQYLRYYLSGEAKAALSGLLITDANYKEAVDLLHERFGDEQAIISTHMNALCKLEAVESCKDVVKLRRLHDETEAAVRSLKGLNIKPEMYGVFLTPLLMNKIPEELRIVLSRNSQGKTWDLEEILKVFHQELQIREKCSATTDPFSKQKESKFLFKKKVEQPTSSAALFSSNSNQSKTEKRDPWCLFCKQSHNSGQCTVVTNIDARRKILREKGRCFVCLRSGHIATNCTVSIKCFKCGKRHHVALCAEKNQGQNTGENNTSNLYVGGMMKNDRCVLLQTAKAKIFSPRCPSNEVNVRILFDSGSQKSYVNARVRDYLHLPVSGKENILIKTFGNNEPKFRESEIVQLGIQCTDGLQIFVNAYSVPLICSPIEGQCIDFAQKQYTHIKNIPTSLLADFSTASQTLEIDVLIGSDYYWQFITGPTARGEGNVGPLAILSRLGYVLTGPVDVPSEESSGSSTNYVSTHVLCCESKRPPLHSELKRFWDYETLGIKDDEPPVYEKFLEIMSKVDGRYEISLPFKEDHPVIPDNYSLCKQRLDYLLKRLKSKPEILSEYDSVIQEQLDAGIVEHVQSNDDKSGVGNIHFLPHREVIRSDRATTRLRVVYDASSKRKNEVSLNDCLYKGPPLAPLIFDILTRFRMHEVVLIADIEKAFLNIGIKPEQRDFLRFLWLKNIKEERPEVVQLRFTRLVFGLVSSPFVLNATIRAHLSKYSNKDSEFVSKALNSVYVDDHVASFATKEEAFDMYQKLKRCFQEAGLNMRKWDSNSSELVSKIQSEEKRFTNTNDEADKDDEENSGYAKTELKVSCDKDEAKVLGLAWNRSSDTIKINFSQNFENVDPNQVTNRDILSCTSKCYDPLGLLAPVVVPLKLMFQSMCKEKVDWDEPLSEEINQQWQATTSQIKKSGAVEISRCVLKNSPEDKIVSTELHGFSDASKDAYGAVVYMRVERESGKVDCNIIASKSRVAPLKGETIPRLELLSALILARLMNTVKVALKEVVEINRTVYWLDSQIALWWIFGTDKEFNQFVQHRVIEIRKLSNPEDWRYCPTDLNPADYVSRGVGAMQFVENRAWFKGPEFLEQEKKTWPNTLTFECKQATPSDVVCQAERELKSNRHEQTTSSVNQVISESKSLSNVLPCESYSDIDKLLRITAYVLRFCNNLKRRVTKEGTSQGALKAEEIKSAKTVWIKHVQKTTPFSRSFDKTKGSLSVFEDDDGIMRCRGRLQNAPISMESRHPILLPHESHLTKLLVLKAHSAVMHNGVAETLAQLRSSFWIIRGRQLVRSLLSKCVICRHLQGRSFDSPDSPPLPDFRVNSDFAFTNVGVDYAGPLYVKDIYAKLDEMNKAYILLTTCATTRAVHLELCPDLQTKSFIRAFTRFQGRRGTPSLVVSDNAKTFKEQSLKRYLLARNIQWKFNVPRASWWGGFWEIMVKSVKRCLKKVLGNARLTFEEMDTILIEVEGVLNSRPLTYIHSELEEEPLTPSSLVCGKRLLSTPSESKVAAKSTLSDLTKRESYLKTLLNHFWSRWRREYLPSLREFHRNLSSSRNKTSSIKEGDIVYISQQKILKFHYNFLCGNLEERHNFLGFLMHETETSLSS